LWHDRGRWFLTKQKSAFTVLNCCIVGVGMAIVGYPPYHGRLLKQTEC
jgi:hypothetical protein